MTNVNALATIIVVEDDTALNYALGVLLESAGYQYRCYGSAEMFLDSELPSPPSCIVSDYRLPGIDGIELQRRLALRKSYIPILLLSAEISDPEIDEALRDGVYAVMRKPFDPEGLLDLMAGALKSAG